MQVNVGEIGHPSVGRQLPGGVEVAGRQIASGGLSGAVGTGAVQTQVGEEVAPCAFYGIGGPLALPFGGGDVLVVLQRHFAALLQGQRFLCLTGGGQEAWQDQEEKGIPFHVQFHALRYWMLKNNA